MINEIINSITKSRTLEGMLVIVSLPFVGSVYHHNNKPTTSVLKLLTVIKI
jgi:hypothetical protein